jgi:hypothetical protein
VAGSSPISYGARICPTAARIRSKGRSGQAVHGSASIGISADRIEGRAFHHAFEQPVGFRALAKADTRRSFVNSLGQKSSVTRLYETYLLETNRPSPASTNSLVYSWNCDMNSLRPIRFTGLRRPSPVVPAQFAPASRHLACCAPPAYQTNLVPFPDSRPDGRRLPTMRNQQHPHRRCRPMPQIRLANPPGRAANSGVLPPSCRWRRRAQPRVPASTPHYRNAAAPSAHPHRRHPPNLARWKPWYD